MDVHEHAAREQYAGFITIKAKTPLLGRYTDITLYSDIRVVK
jgi:hypothetical protein